MNETTQKEFPFPFTKMSCSISIWGQLDPSTERSIRNNFDLQVLTASNGYRLPTGDLAWYQALGGQEGNTYPDRVYHGTE